MRARRRVVGGRAAAAVLAATLLAGACSGGDSDRADTSTPTSASGATSQPATSASSPDSGASGSTADRSSALFAAVCEATATITDVGELQSPEITEASGLAASWANDDAWWIHNDSGDTARIFLISGDGALLSTVTLDGAEERDWESIAVGPGARPLESIVYVGDTGDNAVMRDPSSGRGSFRVFRFAEPVIDRAAAPTESSVDVDSLTFEFPDGAHDVEALLVDPIDNDLVVITKDWQRTGSAQVFRADAEVAAGSTTTLEAVGSVPLEPGTLVTAADVTSDGSLVALRSYGAVHLYERAAGEPLWTAFESAPCEGPVPTERQGESLAFAPDGRWYLTVSEGEQSTLHRTG
jgi:hypothetical protein